MKTAIFWIRDGVLVDRMHVNPVAFAVAALAHADPFARQTVDLTALINFGFAVSGISCADKIRKFNSERTHLVTDVDAAAAFYNELATSAGSRCSFFEGALELVADLKVSGALNFITSAVEQEVMDRWATSEQGARLAPHLTETLGQRPNFSKGRDHFEYVVQHYQTERIFYVADAVIEIGTGAKFKEQYGIVPIGFAHVITRPKVKLALDVIIDCLQSADSSDRLRASSKSCSSDRLVLHEDRLVLPDENELVAGLLDAGADETITGSAQEVMGILRQSFDRRGLLAAPTGGVLDAVGR